MSLLTVDGLLAQVREGDVRDLREAVDLRVLAGLGVHQGHRGDHLVRAVAQQAQHSLRILSVLTAVHAGKRVVEGTGR